MEDLIKKILREEKYWQVTDDDKWNSLEKDLRYVVERLIERHKDSWGGDQYAVMGAIEQVLEGMFQKVPMGEQRELQTEQVDKVLSSDEDGEFFKRLSIVLNQMKNLEGLNTWIEGLHKHGNPAGYGYTNKAFHLESKNISDGIWGIIKIFVPPGAQTIGTQELVYLTIKTFLVNGGYGSDFNPDNLKLPTITVYGMEADKEQELIEYSGTYGKLIGAENEEQAIEMFTNFPGSWEEDSDNHDMDYGDVLSIDNVAVYEKTTKEWRTSYLGI
tara:strand:+ start:3991 stop:4806 length:816 start_codon:yes stop_codon:yes gene_type:complete